MGEGNLIQLQNNNIFNQQLNEPNPPQLPRPDLQNKKNNPSGALAQLKQLADHGITSPQVKVIKNRITVATKIMEQYYGKKASELDPTGERATKRQKQRLEEMVDDFSAQRASATALHAMPLEDYKSATMWTLHAYRIARIIAGKNQSRRESALKFEQFKGILSAEISALDVLSDEPKKKIKDNAKTQKILADQEKQIPQAASSTPIVQSITQSPPQQQQPPSFAQVQTPIFQQLHFQQFPQQHTASFLMVEHRSVIKDDVFKIGICNNNNSSNRTSPHPNNNLNHFRFQTELRRPQLLETYGITSPTQVRKKKKMTMKHNFDQELNQDNNELVPNRLINRIGKWEEIGSAYSVLKGAQPNWISIHQIQKLNNSNNPPIFKSTKYQEQEYNTQLTQELNQGVVVETDQILIQNLSFLTKRADGRYYQKFDCRLINQLTNLVHLKMDGVVELVKLMEKGDYATTLDIIDAFLHIKVSPNLQPYLGFMSKMKSFAYAALSFGYKRSRLIFLKMLSIAIQTIRKT
ncbi:MAG: hypothetical protein EZS28_010155 [Streblomastix strix]|uniref:Reverse transcriptase domain-containing protein n=1 Tax=Streblomastix strix TaxID=222440 RepID=A0A5J4WIY0_9EUKA|nr:MAG: hypothetical protein EZS28_010155 [Streblomastix strix]